MGRTGDSFMKVCKRHSMTSITSTSTKHGNCKVSVLLMLLMFLCVCFFLAPGDIAEAGEKADVNSIVLHSDETGTGDASFALYKIAEKQDDGSFVLTKDFEDSHAEVNDLTTDGLASLGTTLSPYVVQKKPASISTQKMVDGTCQWTNLSDGLYLAVGEPIIANGKIIEFSPVVAYLPYTGDGDEIHSLDAVVKSVSRTVPKDVIEYQVEKIWKDGDSANRPSEVEVSLIQQSGSGNRVYSTCVLNKENNWSYTWKDLPADATYTAVETEVPEGYTQSVSRKSGKTVIINSRKNKPSPSVSPSPSPSSSKNTNQPTPYGTGNPTPSVSETARSGQNTGRTNLPQTGQLWWPVPLLIVGGLLCILLSLFKRNNSGDRT